LSAVGILGGTFDPVHLGHLVLAESARETFGLARVVFVPAGQPPHKPGTVITPARERLHMVEIAIADHPLFAVSPIEVERPGPSYTVDTIGELCETEPAAEWCLIVGGDALAEIPTWHDYRTLLTLVTVLAAGRPGISLALPPELYEWPARVSLFYPPSLDISATMIRERIQRGLSIRYLVPGGVAAYLAEHRLYSASW